MSVRREPSQGWLATFGFLVFFLYVGTGRAETDRQKEHLVGLVKTVRTEGARMLQQNNQYVEEVRQAVVTVSYNTFGNRTEEVPGQSDLVGIFAGISYGSAKTYYFYNSAGKIIECVVAGFDNTLMVRTLYFYDSQGRTSGAKTESYDGSMSGTMIYAYDEKGRLTAKEGGIGSTTYTYDDKGNLIKEEYERVPSVVHTSIYTYDEQGRKTTITSYDPHDPGLGIKKVETTYDTQGKPVTSLTYYTHKEGWVTQEEQEAEAKRKIPLPKGWFYAYEYDAYGNWVKRTDWECETNEQARKLVCTKPSFVFYRTITYYPTAKE